MDIHVIRIWFTAIYEWLCGQMGICPRDDVCVTFGNVEGVQFDPHSPPQIIMSEYFAAVSRGVDICAILAHEALHVCLWQKGKEYKDGMANFEAYAEKYHIDTNTVTHIDWQSTWLRLGKEAEIKLANGRSE